MAVARGGSLSPPARGLRRSDGSAAEPCPKEGGCRRRRRAVCAGFLAGAQP